MKLAASVLCIAVCAGLVASAVYARAGTTLTVSAQANIFGAGHLAPSDTPSPGGGGGGVPPVVFAFPAQQFRALTFTNVSGTVDFHHPLYPNGPDGGGVSYRIASHDGIGGVVAPVASLVGVFLGSNTPTNPAPEGLDFNVVGTNFTTLSPQVGQVFFIGDGRTDSGAVQEFMVPLTATRLFLGLADALHSGEGPGYYYDNAGAFSVCVEALPRIEPVVSKASSGADTTVAGEVRGASPVNYRAASDSIPLPRDHAFGFAVPSSVKLSHRIQASTDLIHWEPLGNAALYFKDRDSTNFTQRFYRFAE